MSGPGGEVDGGLDGGDIAPGPDGRIEHGPGAGESILFLHGGNTARWMWGGQVEGLPGRHLITPDLPGYGSRAGEDWPGMPVVADDVATTIRRHALGGRAHVVGLSLGGHVALHLLHRSPELVRSCIVTGVAATGLTRLERRLIAPQLPLWRSRRYWTLQARLFRIPPEDRPRFIASAAAASERTNRRVFAEIVDGSMPRGPFTYDGPLLVVAGQRESRSVRDAFVTLRAALPQTRTWIAPSMHHPWNAEDPELFSSMVATFVDTGEWPPSPTP